MNWKALTFKICERYFNNGFSRPPLSHIHNAAEHSLEFKPKDYSSPNMPSEDYRTFYNYIMTLAKREGLTDDFKVNKLFEFLDLVGVDHKWFNETMAESGHQFTGDKLIKLLNQNNKNTTKGYNQRNFHDEVVKHSQNLYSQGNYFHAVQEACKAYNNKVKELSGSVKDGVSLMLQELSVNGRIKINRNITSSEINEQNGIKALSEGLMSAFRNPTAHENAIDWVIGEDECLDILSLVSFLFKKLDSSTII